METLGAKLCFVLRDLILVDVIHRILRLDLMVSPDVDTVWNHRVEHVDVWNNHVFFYHLVLAHLILRKVCLVSLIAEAWRVQKAPLIWWSSWFVYVLFVLHSSIWILYDRRVPQGPTVVTRITLVINVHIWTTPPVDWYLIFTTLKSTRVIFTPKRSLWYRKLVTLRLNEIVESTRWLLSIVKMFLYEKYKSIKGLKLTAICSKFCSILDGYLRFEAEDFLSKTAALYFSCSTE